LELLLGFLLRSKQFNKLKVELFNNHLLTKNKTNLKSQPLRKRQITYDRRTHMNIILLGAPGSGKGTMSELLIEKKQLIQLSTGDLFRHNISNKTELGVEAQKYMNEGKYVPDSITNGMVEDFLKSNNDNLIFDGFPRTENQALALDEMLKKLDSEIGKVFLLD